MFAPLACSYETLRKHAAELRGAFDLLVCDEGHRWVGRACKAGVPPGTMIVTRCQHWFESMDVHSGPLATGALPSVPISC